MLLSGVNPLVRAHILSETLLWSAWNFFTPIAAIFVTTNIDGGSIEVAATAYSIYLMVRVLFELISGKFLAKSTDKQKLAVSIAGISLISISYIGFAFSKDIFPLILFYVLLGIGLGSSTPAKSSLFSIHLDKTKEPAEWSMSDALVLMGMAISGVIGGFMANQFGFQTLFILASVVNLLSIIPYLLRFR